MIAFNVLGHFVPEILCVNTVPRLMFYLSSPLLNLVSFFRVLGQNGLVFHDFLGQVLLITGELLLVGSRVEQQVGCTQHDLVEGLGCLEAVSQLNLGVNHVIWERFTCFVML